MEDLNDLIDTLKLESEVKEAISSDRLYWLQNEAKIRAVTDQKVTSYDEFVGRVKVAHLRPLTKADRLSADSIKAVWNPCVKKKGNDYCKTQEHMISNLESSRFSSRLQDKLRSLDSEERKYALLRDIGSDEILRSFKKEIPVGTFGELLGALLVFPNTTQDVVFVVSVLEALTKTERFRLSLEFLTCTEKDRLQVLLDKVSRSLPNRHQDLAEENVTEWTVEKLKEKYSVSAKNR